jgi:hypothetical protein
LEYSKKLRNKNMGKKQRKKSKRLNPQGVEAI